MSITEREKAKLTSASPKNRTKHAPDPTWRAQQAFIRATRRGSKKHASMERKLELLDGATTAIPQPARLLINPATGKPEKPLRLESLPRVRAAVNQYLRSLTLKEKA